MLKKLTTIALNTLTAFWVVAALLLVASGYSDRLSPEVFVWAPALGLAFPFMIALNLLFLLLFITFCWRRAWLPVAAFAVTYPPISLYIPLNGSTADKGSIADGQTMTVMSYNMLGFNGPGPKDDKNSVALGQIVAYLRQQQPDLLCAQECMDGWRGAKQRLDSIFAHSDTLTLVKDAKRYNAIGIFTRYPILGRERIQYRSFANGSVAWTLLRGRDTLLVVNNHLETTHLNKSLRNTYHNMLHGDEPADTMRLQTRHIAGVLAGSAIIRVQQARAVAHYTDSVRQRHPSWLLVVCGDFNDSPISYTHRVMASGLTDCFQAAGNGTGWSMQAKAFPVRIDNVICSDRLSPVSCKIDRSITASDHYPIIATLRVER